MGKDKLKSKTTMTRAELVAYLETLLTGLKQGALILDNEERPMILRPSDAIEAEVEIKQKTDKEKVELKLCWVPNRMQTLVAAHPDAAILSSDPAGDEAKKNEPGDVGPADCGDGGPDGTDGMDGMDQDGLEASPEPVFDAEREVTEMLTDEALVASPALPPSVAGSAPVRGRAKAFPVSPAVKALLDVVTEALLDGESVSLPGLGSFTVQSHSARMGRNPRTGERIAIPAGEKVHFKNAEGLRRLLNPDG